ncbi:MAG: hypothetical protein K5662_08575 [Lachnospiraceae bacterium]|nr:hypothetical protein [Lachnospiraceae bacterium]
MKINDLIRYANRILLLIAFMLIGYRAGDTSMGIYFSIGIISMSIFFWLVGGVKKTTARLIRVQKKKMSGSGGEKILKMGLAVSVALTGLYLLVTLVLGGKLSELFLGTYVGDMIFAAFGFLLLLYGVNGCFKGYYQGENDQLIIYISDLINGLLFVILVAVFIKRFITYGEKAALLLHEPIIMNAYSAFGAVILQCVALLVADVYLVAVYISQVNGHKRGASAFKGGEYNDNLRRRMIIGSFAVTLERAFPATALAAFIIAYMHFGIRHADSIKTLFINNGVIASKVITVILVPLYLFNEYMNREGRKLVVDYEHQDEKNFRIRVNLMLKNALFILIPVMLTVFFLRTPIVKIFFDGKMSLGIKLLSKAAVIILIGGLSISYKTILKAFNMNRIILTGSVIASVSGLAYTCIACHKTAVPSIVIWAMVIYYATDMLVMAYFVHSSLKVNMYDLLIKAVKCIVAGAAASIVAVIIDKIFVMNIIHFVITIAIITGVYMSIVVLLHGIKSRDINSLKGTVTYYPAFFFKNLLDRKF